MSGPQLRTSGSRQFAPQAPALVFPVAGMIGGQRSPIAFAANDMRGVRCIVPRSGTLKDVYVWIGTSSGNLRGLVWDDTATTRNRLWDSGSLASPGTGWQKLGDPNISVYAGQHIDLSVAADNATVTFDRWVLPGATAAQLPAGFIPSPNGAAAWLNWNVASSFSPGTTLSEGALTTTSICPVIIARVV